MAEQDQEKRKAGIIRLIFRRIGPGLLALFVILVLMAGCSSPFTRVEPLTFNHPDEMIRAADDAEQYLVVADRRIFAVMAFLNTVGFDKEVSSREMHPIRLKVRRMIAENLTDHPDKLRVWRQYYKRRFRIPCQYINYALSMNSEYPFKRIRPNKELSYAWIGWDLAGLPKVLNDFWVTAELDQVWAECKDDYINKIKQYDVLRMAKQMIFLWEYLRMEREDNYTIIHIPNPLDRHYTANANKFEHYFYSVDGPGSNDGGLNVHEYLHTFINDLVSDNCASQKRKLNKYFDAGKDAPISGSYPKLDSWISECLVHALDYRIRVNMRADPAFQKRIKARVDSLTQEGYTILRPLYESLVEFEKTDMPFDQYLPIMLEKLPEYRQ
ncbi:MAG: hypothetical protein PVJ86_05610 [Phycisphaerales bacterium]